MGNKINYCSQPLYEFQDQCTFKMKSPSYAIAINQSGSLILTNEFSKISTFAFNGKSLKGLSYINQHNCVISVLKFFNLKDQFISGSSDHQIYIWPTILNLGTTKKFIQKLQGHTGMITCLVIHPLNEDLIVSGDYEKRIKFWSIQNSPNKQQSSLQWICIQEILELKSQVCDLSINEMGDKVISCDRNSLILVIQKNVNSNYWFVIQKIDLQSHEGAGVTFLKDDSFIFQSTFYSTLDLYILQQEGKYRKAQQIQLKYQNDEQIRQTLQYNKKQKILTVKKGQQLFIIRFEEQNNYDKSKIVNDFLILKDVQQINLKTYFFQRALSDNGQYLITKDNLSRSIKIWSLRTLRN